MVRAEQIGAKVLDSLSGSEEAVELLAETQDQNMVPSRTFLFYF